MSAGVCPVFFYNPLKSVDRSCCALPELCSISLVELQISSLKNGPTAKKHTKNAPFNFCFSIFSLLAASSASENRCPECNPNVTYKCGTNGLSRHRRPTKPKELARTSKSVKFQISNELSKRTNKHKKSYISNLSKKHRSSWTPDSGATVSVTNRVDLFETIEDHFPNKRVRVANGSSVDVMFTGSIRLNVINKDGVETSILVRDVCYSPHFSGNLLSVRELSKQHGIEAVFGQKSYLRTPEGDKIPIPENHGKQYILKAYATSSVDDAELWHCRFMHAGNDAIKRVIETHLTHLSGTQFDFSKCHACLQGGARKLSFGTTDKRIRVQDKSNNLSKSKRFWKFGQRISSDLCGPFPVAEDGSKYCINFHDSSEKYVVVYFLKDKDKETVLEAFQQFLFDHSKQLPDGVGLFHTDNGGEYQNRDMERFCEEICTKQSYTVPYLPQQNPYAERTWGDLLRKVRTAMVAAKLPDKYWTYAMRQAALVHNIIPDKDGSSPWERVHDETYSYSRLHVLGCLCYYLVPKRDLESKLSPRALPAVYLGEESNRNGHTVYVPSLRRITAAYHVVFNERRFYDFDRSHSGSHVRFDTQSSPTRRSGANFVPVTRTSDHQDGHDAENNHDEDDGSRTPQPGSPDYSPANDMRHGTMDEWNDDHCDNSNCLYPKGHDGLCSDMQRSGTRSRVSQVKDRSLYLECTTASCIFHADHCGSCRDDDNQLTGNMEACEQVTSATGPEDEDDYDLVVVTDEFTGQTIQVDTNNGDIQPPKNDREAENGPLASRWWESRTKEIKDLVSHGTWKEISRNDPICKNRKPTKSRWVYTIKYQKDGTIERFKSRFVVCGYSQRQGVDYDRAFSATLRATTFRILLAKAAGQNMRLEHFDVTNAFTQADMDDVDLFIEPPTGFETWETDKNGKVILPRVSKLLHLQKALYGTKQASRLWQETLRTYLTDAKRGFKQSTADPCVFHSNVDAGEITIGIYVDDIVVAWKGQKAFDKFKSDFLSHFNAKHIGPLNWFLGMEINQNENYSINLNQTQYIQKMCDKYIPNNNVSRVYPDPEVFKSLGKAKDDVERARVVHYKYNSVIGSILYAAVMSRPDIAYHASVLAKFMSDPSLECCTAAIHLLQYLHSTRNKKMVFSGKISVPDGMQKHAKDITSNHGFVAYSDSSWGNEHPYPMYGYNVYLYGGLISFASKQLKTVAFSSCEAEYAAASSACKEIAFVRNVCDDMGITLHSRLVLGVDNTAAIDVAHDSGVSARTKHFDRAIHYLRDLTTLRHILPYFVNTNQQRADGLTKCLNKSKFITWTSCVMQD